MITTTKHIDAMKCDICATELKPEHSREVPSVPALFGGRICCNCDHKFKRSTIPSSGQTPVEKDYKAFLDGKREYAITVRITCADGCEINSPISDKAAKSFLVS